MSNKTYHYYYFDEQNDDFANNGIEGKPTPKDYEYLPKSIVFRFFKPIIYHFTLLFFRLGLFFICKVKNKKVIKKRLDKKKGYFVYGNHTGWFMDAVSGPVACTPRQAYTIVNPDAMNITGLKTLIKLWGALPTPNEIKTYANLVKTVEKLYNKGNPIVIYPEAHIWPKYNEIRNFPSVSFNYPAKLNAPCFVKSTVFKKKKNGLTKPVAYIDGPIYPNMDLPLKERQQDLRNKVYEKMVERTANSALDIRYTYTKVNSKEEVRSEFGTL